MSPSPTLPITGSPSRWTFRGSIVTILVLLLAGFASLVWTPFPTDGLDVGATLQGPGGHHWLGTDQLGRDVLSMVMRGTLTSFVVAAVGVLIGVIAGVPLGFVAARFPQISFIASSSGDFILLFPAIVAAIALATVLGPTSVNAMLAIGVVSILGFARVVRDGLRRFDGLDYLAASRLAGMESADVAWRQIYPTMSRLVAAQVLVQMGIGVLTEATLAFVGLAAQAPTNSLGLILKDAQGYASLNPLPALVPGLIVLVLAAALTFAGDRLRHLTLTELNGGAVDADA